MFIGCSKKSTRHSST